MSGNSQMEIHCIDTGFPYTATESFMDLFEGLTYAQSSVGLSDPFHDQGTLWELRIEVCRKNASPCYLCPNSSAVSFPGRNLAVLELLKVLILYCNRCVICQMDYKRGDRQMTLPCKHVYHVGCVTR